MNWEADIMLFDPEELRSYDNRSGFDLVSCQKVGLPVYKITVDALTQVRKPIPPIEEYVLKAIDAGLSSEEDIAGFLGLELSTVIKVMVNLRVSEDIDLMAVDTSQIQIWKLTKKGIKTLAVAKIIVPQERTFEFNFDGLLRISRWYGQSEKTLLKPKKLRDEGIVEIEPSSKNPPELADLKLRDINEIIQEIEKSKERKSRYPQEQDLLALKAIERRDRFFQPATALVYKDKDSDDIQISFIVNGILSIEHETTFARSEGFKKIRSQILNSFQQNESRKLIEEILGQKFVTNNLIDPDEITANVAEKKEELEVQIELTQEKLDITSDKDEKNDLFKQLKEKEKEILQLQTQIDSVLASVPIRWLEMYDHRPLLEKALINTQERLMIVSPWIRANSVNSWFLKQLEELLKREVHIFIGYGLGDRDEKRYLRDIEAEKALQKLASQYSKTFKLKRMGDTHAKVLLSDTQFAVTTSFNWLSFKGERDRTFRDERGMLVSDEQKINELFENLLKRFAEND